MHYDFVDIGTSDFDYSTIGNVLLVEPLAQYLDSITDFPNITKANFAIGNVNTTADIYFVPKEEIESKSLPYHLKGCNSIGKPHDLVLSDLRETPYDSSIIKHETITIITFLKLCELYDVTSIGELKIDTEGYEYQIMQSVAESTIPINTIDIELHNGHYDMDDFMSVITKFCDQDFNFEIITYPGERRALLKRN